MSEDDVNHVKTTLLDLLKHISNKSNPVYTLIYDCVSEFYMHVPAKTSYMAQSNGSDPTSSWQAINVYHPQAIANIKIRVIPWLEQAKSDEASARAAFGNYYDKFVALCTYVDSRFAPRAPVRPAPPVSHPSPPYIDSPAKESIITDIYENYKREKGMRMNVENQLEHLKKELEGAKSLNKRYYDAYVSEKNINNEIQTELQTARTTIRELRNENYVLKYGNDTPEKNVNSEEEAQKPRRPWRLWSNINPIDSTVLLADLRLLS